MHTKKFLVSTKNIVIEKEKRKEILNFIKKSLINYRFLIIGEDRSFVSIIY